MKRKKIVWIVLALVALAVAALILFSPSARENENAAGTMAKICPVNPYHAGDQIDCPCLLRPNEESSFLDANNCQFVFRNTSAYTIPKGTPVVVTRQRTEGTVQHVEVKIPK